MSSASETIACSLTCCICLTITLTLILLPMSIHRLEYNQMGLVKNKFAGTVDRTETYENGLHWIGPVHNFVVYPSTALSMSVKGVSAWTSSEESESNVVNSDSAGTNLHLNVDIQYQLDPDYLGNLHSKVSVNYEPLIRKTIVNAIKDESTKHSADKYLSERYKVEQAMFKSIKSELFNTTYSNLIGLQLTRVKFPARFYNRKLQSSVQLLKNQEEEFKQESQLIRGQTKVEVQNIRNDAEFVKREAESKSNTIIEQANNKAKTTIDTAKSRGLVELSIVGVTKYQLITLDYLIELEQNGKNNNYFVNFEPDPVLVS